MFSLTSIIDLASSEGCLWRLVDRLSFKFGFPNLIQTQENILKPRIVFTDLVDGSYELFTSGHVVFRQLENTALIIKNEYKLKINLPSRRFWQPPHGFETRFVKTLFFSDHCWLMHTEGIQSQKVTKTCAIGLTTVPTSWRNLCKFDSEFGNASKESTPDLNHSKRPAANCFFPSTSPHAIFFIAA